MRGRFLNLSLMVSGVLAAVAVAEEASAATTNCSEGRCSTGRAPLTLEGKDPLRTSIDTGWMPSCDNGQEHCNKGLQVRANIALTAVADNENLFTTAFGPSAAVQASWETEGYLSLRTESLTGQDGTFTVKHSLEPQVELYLDIGPVEQGWTFSAARLLQLLPGARFGYESTASAPFNGWAFDGTSVVLPKPALQSAQLFSVELASLSDVIGKVANGSLSIHAQASPTVTFKTTKVIVDGRELRTDASTQVPFPDGDFDFLEFPATIEAELSATGDIDILPAATLSNLGDMNFSPPVTITFSSVKVTKHFAPQPQKYVFKDKTIRIPLPNIRRHLEELRGEAELGDEGIIPAIATNTGESSLIVRLESSDPRFVVSSTPIEISPKSNRALDIAFHPDALGPAEATIKAYTNDPDTPELTFQVRATGVEPGTLGPNGKGKGKGEAEEAIESGCGCKTTGGSTSGYAGLGAFALGLVAFLRRRR